MFKRLALAVALTAAFSASRAADLPIKALALPPVALCTPQSCSGWYGGFGFSGNGTNMDIVGSGINGSVFAAGGAVMIHGGYQFWSGTWFAAVEGAAGYQFTTNVSGGVPAVNGGGSKFVGQELIKLGYNFFPSTAVATTTPSQSPVSLLTPANLLSASTPYLVGGGCQNRGNNVWCNGVGIETVIAQSWTTSADYLYAPAQGNMDAMSLVQLKVSKHF